MYSQESEKVLLKRGTNSPVEIQNRLLVELIYFSSVGTFDLKSKQWVIFLFRSIIYHTNKKDYSIYSSNKGQACCHLATPGHKSTKNWKRSNFFPQFNSDKLVLVLIQTVKQIQTSLICPSLPVIR